MHFITRQTLLSRYHAICHGAAFQPFFTFKMSWQLELRVVEPIPSMAAPLSAGMVLIQLGANEDGSSRGFDPWWGHCRKTFVGERTRGDDFKPTLLQIQHRHTCMHTKLCGLMIFFFVLLDLTVHHRCTVNCNSDPRPVSPTCVFRTLEVFFSFLFSSGW